jgi:hypothetical protein
VIHPKTIAGRKAYFDRMRALVNSDWVIDHEGTVHIPLSLGREALIDSSDMELAQKFRWRLRIHSSKSSNKCYAEAPITEEMRAVCNSDKKNISLHRLLMGSPGGLQIDHRDGDGLNCRRKNMRPATESQNTSNRKYKNKTGYRGVFVSGRKYGAQIEVNGKNRHLGVRSTPEEAAILYDVHALETFGEFSILNFPEALSARK